MSLGRIRTIWREAAVTSGNSVCQLDRISRVCCRFPADRGASHAPTPSEQTPFYGHVLLILAVGRSPAYCGPESDEFRVSVSSLILTHRVRPNAARTKPAPTIHRVAWELGLTLCPALIGLSHNLSSALVRRRAPLADVFDMPEAARTHFALIQPTYADARRWNSRADVAEQRFWRFYRRGTGGHSRLPSEWPSIASNSSSAPACLNARRWSISPSSSSLLSHTQRLSSSS